MILPITNSAYRVVSQELGSWEGGLVQRSSLTRCDQPSIKWIADMLYIPKLSNCYSQNVRAVGCSFKPVWPAGSTWAVFLVWNHCFLYSYSVAIACQTAKVLNNDLLHICAHCVKGSETVWLVWFWPDHFSKEVLNIFQLIQPKIKYSR